LQKPRIKNSTTKVEGNEKMSGVCSSVGSVNVCVLDYNDFEKVFDIFNSIFPKKYNIEFKDAWDARNKSLTFGAFDSKHTLLGFVLTRQISNNQQQIEFLGVDPTCQKGGIGTILLQKILDHCIQTNSRATLIPVNDPRIIHWYKKHGFNFCGEPFVSSYTGDVEQIMQYVV
jgi:ribosomal protein S18 acetylase RimI-like enzyme